MTRKILGVVAGYAIFVASASVFFKLSGKDAHVDTSASFVISTAIEGIVFSFIGGFVLQLIAKTANLKLNFILAFVMASFAAFSYFKSGGNHWTQLLAIFVFAPTSILGGWFYLKQKLGSNVK